MSVQAVLVDLGGVWLQDGDFTERERWAAEHGTTAANLFEAYIDAIGGGWESGRSEAVIHGDLLARLGLGPESLAGLLTALHAHETLDPDLTTFLQTLRPARRIGIITNAGPSARHQLEAKFGFSALADAMVVSAEEGVSKPDPRIYLTACARLGVEPRRCVFLDDKPANVDGARVLGMAGIHVRTVAQAIADLHRLLGDSPVT